MELSVGKIIIYPHHGPVKVAKFLQQTISGESKELVVLHAEKSDLIIQVPVDNIKNVGAREIISEKELKKLIKLLKQKEVEEQSTWTRRFKVNTEKLETGQIDLIAEVLRDLWRRDRIKPLSSGEKRLIDKARAAIVTEFALAKNIAEDEADIFLEEVLLSFEK